MTLTIGLSANDGGAHTRELVDGFAAARDWLGIPATYVWADDGRDPERARKAAASMVAADLPLVIGHLSAAASVVAAEIYRKNNVVLIAPATSHPDLNPTNGPGILRVCGTDARTAEAMIASLPNTGPVLILTQRQLYGLSLGQALETAFLAIGRHVHQHIIDGDPETATLPTGFPNILVSGIHEFCAEIVKKIARDGESPYIGLGDDCLTPNFPLLTGLAGTGCQISGPIVPDIPDPANQGYFPACTIATCIGLQALRDFPHCRGEALGHAMRTRSWQTPHGVYYFDQNGDIQGFSDRTFELFDGSFRSVNRRLHPQRQQQDHSALPLGASPIYTQGLVD